jgi:hypothetical protein
MKLWSDFYDLVLPHVPNCPDVAVDIALRQSAITFCEQSKAWTYTYPDIAVAIGVSQYSYNPPDQSAVDTVIHAEFSDCEIGVNVSENNLPIRDWRDQTGTPQYVLGGSTGITLVPSPDIDGTLSLIVTLKPSPTAIGVDDTIYNEYREALAYGAVAQLMISPKKPYSNPQLAAYYQELFIIKTGQAGIRSDRNYTREPLRTTIMRRM